LRSRPNGATLANLQNVATRILIVDDEETILFALREYFTNFGYQVDCAREIEEAEALLAFVQYQVVMADLRLTGSHGAEGLEIIGYVRERCPWTRIILLTAYGSPEVEAEALRRGADAFLHKPKPLAEVARILVALAGVPS
jgi:DNA-binding response OmpR family regulator